MITDTLTIPLTAAERVQVGVIQMAREVWEEGRAEDALAMLDAIASRPMTPRVAVRFFVARSAYLAELNQFDLSDLAIEKAAPHLDHALPITRGAFFNQRARLRKRAGNLDAALTDYAGAAIYWEMIQDRANEGAARLNIAELYLSRGDLSRSAENLQAALCLLSESQSRDLAQAYDTEAKLRLAEGRLADAVTAITNALTLVGENEGWRKQFIETRENIDTVLISALRVFELKDLDRIRLHLVRRALIETDGSLTHAGKRLGVTHHAIAFIVDQNKELEPYRAKRRVRRKSLEVLKKTK